MSTSDSAGLLKDVSVLTLPNQVSLSNLTTIRSLNAGALTARAWETLRAAVQGVALPRTAGPIRNEAGNAVLSAWPDQDLPRMRRGAERC